MVTKDLTHYFKHAERSSFPSSVSQSTINSVNRKFSEVRIKCWPKVTTLRVEVNISELMLINELSCS